MLIREELDGDQDAIRQITRAAFEGDAEALLIDSLRDEHAVITSLVAIAGAEITGHILFSRITVVTATSALSGASLAPMAVRPDLQRRGIGAQLVRRGLELCRERGVSLVVVLGHPGYYPRFGFDARLARNLRSPYPAGQAWMALELVPGSLSGVEGWVVYPKAFDQISG